MIYIGAISWCFLTCFCVVSRYHRRDKLQRHSHVATKTFQALRIFVNDELNEVDFAMRAAHRLLRPDGVCVAISFHSLEDRIVKHAFTSRLIEDKEEKEDVAKSWKSSSDSRKSASERLVTEKDLENLVRKKWSNHKYYEPSPGEVLGNPRARSAKLRVARKSE